VQFCAKKEMKFCFFVFSWMLSIDIMMIFTDNFCAKSKALAGVFFRARLSKHRIVCGIVSAEQTLWPFSSLSADL